MHRPSTGGSSGRRRAQSGPLGLLLVFAMVVASTTALVALGAGAVADSESRLDVSRTEKAMTQFDSQAALVALGQSSVQRVDLSRAGTQNYRVDGEAGWMNVSYRTAGGDRTTIFNTSMGALVYDDGEGTTVAYQGGGVWRSDDGGSVMISPPEFHYRSATLTLPLVTVAGGDAISGRAVVTHDDSRQYFPNQSLDPEFRNPLEGSEVNVTVHSDYYGAWGAYFEERTEGNVTYDDPAEQVTIELTVPFQETFSNVVATTEPGGISVKGSSEKPEPYDDGVNYPSVDGEIEDQIEDCEDGTDPCVDSFSPDSITSSGIYSHDGDLTGDVDVDTPGGDVTLVVDGEFNPDNVEVDIAGDHALTVYAREDFTIDGGAMINDDDGDARELRLLVHSDGDVDFNGDPRFVGLVFAPYSECDLNGNSDVEGGLICETMDINGNPNEFDYDPAVADVVLDLNDADETLITYLHVSINDVNVTSG